MKKTIALIVTLCFTISLIASEKKHSKTELIADIDSLYFTIHTIHPNMFAFVPKHEFEAQLEKVKLQVKDSMTRIEFHNIISPLISDLGDGHTSVYFPYNLLPQHKCMFPFAVKINHVDSSIFVTHNFLQESQIPAGAEIISINGRNAKEMTGKMIRYISGEMMAYRAAMLQQRFSPLLYALYNDTIFTVEFKYQNKIQTENHGGLSYHEFNRFFQQANQHESNYFLSILEEQKIAVIHFNLFHDLDRFKVFIDSAFKVIREKNINDLVIDIRQNNGGRSDIGDEFFQYISSVPFHQFGKVIANQSIPQIRFQNRYYDYNQSEENLGFVSYENSELYELRENPLRFPGNVYLLTSNYTFSSATSFSWAFQYFKMGTIIGEETGGLVVCYGDIIPQFLPNTKLQFGTSYKKFYLYGSTDENTHGTLPNHEVPASEAMDFAIKMILNKRM